VVKEKIQGSVNWSGEMEIKVIRTPGIVKKNAQPEDNIRVIDLNNLPSIKNEKSTFIKCPIYPYNNRSRSIS